ncbi:hypothetical protein ACTFIY_008655 [Dictyostelium cf. discoideum]
MTQISLFPKIPTTGGNLSFNINLPYWLNGEVKTIFIESFKSNPIYNSTLDLFDILVPKGCRSNLFNTSIEIVSIVSNDSEANPTYVGTINDAHTEAKISINEARYLGEWKINVKICDTFHSTYTFLISPELIRMEGVLNDNGGNITFTGNNLRYKQNISGTFV